MQGAIARVCMVIVAAVLNHPLLFPNENTTIPDEDDGLLARMKEHEEKLEAERERLEQEIITSRDAQSRDQDGYGWYFCSALCLVIFFTIEVFRQEILSEGSDSAEEEACLSGCLGDTSLSLDKSALNNFCITRFNPFANENARVREFIEGFADDLTEAMRNVSNQDSGLEIEDFIGIGSMFECWRVSKPPTCDLILPFSPPKPHQFQFEFWCEPSIGISLDLQGCGRIRLVKPGSHKGCMCGSANLGDDMLCLLHNTNECENPEDRVMEDLLCAKDSTYVSINHVTRWFQASVTKAWAKVSHKYEFELAFRNLDLPGALKIRFMSGKTVVLNVTPAVQFENTDCYFIPSFPSDSSSSSDTHWHLSLTLYERNLLKHLAKKLPQNSCHLRCLQIACFLHQKQTALTGRSALTNYHIKTALLHHLLSKRPEMWQSQDLGSRLEELLRFLLKRLEEKRLYHVLVGNPLIPEDIQIPRIIRTAEPINLFRPLVLQRQIYDKMMEHFQEMVKNASVLLQEYALQGSNDGHEFSSTGQM